MEQKFKRFSAREIRALLWLLPVLAVVSWLVWVTTATADSATQNKNSTARNGEMNSGKSGADFTPTEVRGGGDSKNSTALPKERVGAKDAPLSAELFIFDPNTVEYHDLVRLGFTRGEALGIVKYREQGKIFEIPEDFAACYQVSEEMYRRLEPYIRIGEKYRLKPFRKVGEVAASANSEEKSEYHAGAGGMELSPNGSATPPADAPQHVSTEERGGVKGAPPSREILIDLNTADSAALIAVSGIGERTVVSIMEYRARLGGFVAVEQLAEVRGVTEQNYERMIEQIYLDPAVIQKIDINFAPAKSLAAHPYIRADALRKLLKQRQLKGGWHSLGELEADDIFTAEELAKLGPYLSFN